MKIFIAIDDQKKGPFTLFQIEEKLHAEEIGEDTLGWFDGQEKWEPLRDLPPFESFFRRHDADLEDERKRDRASRLATDEAASAPDRSLAKPWTRFWARYLDLWLFLCLCLAALVGLRWAGWTQLTYIDFVNHVFILMLPPWHLLEAYMITRWGATPGKAMLGIQITDREGDLLGYGASLRRSLGVFVVGFGCFIPFLSLLTHVFAYHQLKQKGRTFWDATANSKITHQPFQPRHILLPMALLVLSMIILKAPFEEISEHQRAGWPKILDHEPSAPKQEVGR